MFYGNLSSLEYLQLHGNNFLDNEERLEDENLNDSLYSFTKLINLNWLDISQNSGIRYIKYLMSLTKLRYLYMDGCSNLLNNDIISMKEFINNLIEKTYDSKYSLKLLDNVNQISLSCYNQIIDFADFKAIGECTKLTHLNLRNTKVKKSLQDKIEDNENTVETLMANVFRKLTNLAELSIRNFTIDFGSGEKKIESLDFLSNNSKIVVLDLQDTDVIAKGNNTDLDNDKKIISKKNTDILNSLEKIDCLVVNSEKFDFSNLQILLNRISGEPYSFPNDIDFWGSSNKIRGVVILNWLSFKTLEKCESLKKFISYSYFPTKLTAPSGDFLDLSGCDLLEEVNVYGWHNFKIKFPNCIKVIDSLVTTFSFDFEEPKTGESIYLDRIIVDEVSGQICEQRLKEIVSHDVKVKYLKFWSVNTNYSFVRSFLKNNRCDWLEGLWYNVYERIGAVEEAQLFYDDLYLLADSSIETFETQFCNKKDLNFLKDFTKLKKLSVLDSKIIDINAIVPNYDEERCISGFPELEELKITNSITDITAIGKLMKLKKLDVSGNKINNGIEVLSNLRKLEYINLSNCSSLAQISKYVNLSNSTGSDFFVDIFKDLHTNGVLKELYLKGTGIENIKDRLESGSLEWGVNSDGESALQCDS